MGVTRQQIYDHAVNSLPRWYREANRSFELDNAAASVMNAAASTVEYFLETQANIDTASGATSTAPDWLGQHAIDRGMYRQNGESDTTLRARIKDVPEALTRPSLIAAIQTILDGEGISGSAAIVDLRRERGFLVENTSYPGGTGSNGTGGVFSDESTSANPSWFGFTPSAAWDPTFQVTRTVHEESPNRLIIVSATASANNGDGFPIVSVSGDMIIYSNASGSAGADSVVKWWIDKTDRDDNYTTRYNISGRADMYLSRGDRAGSQRATIIIILPYGSTTGTEASVRALLRDKKAAGVRYYIERRLNP